MKKHLTRREERNANGNRGKTQNKKATTRQCNHKRNAHSNLSLVDEDWTLGDPLDGLACFDGGYGSSHVRRLREGERRL